MPLPRLFGRPRSSQPERVIVREYGRDSLLIWANLLLAPIIARLGLRVGLRSQTDLEARIEADTAAMRKRGYLVAKVETFSLPVVGAPDQAASWYRIRYELTSPPG